MSEVNKNVYPDRSTALSGIQLTSAQLADFALNSEWETSIAISQSTAEFAPYNRVTYITLKNDVIPYTYDATETTNAIQKIALYYTQNLLNIAQTQYYNGAISYSGQSFNIAQLNDAPYNFYSMRRAPVLGAWTEGLINALQQQYNKRSSFLITGADFKKILCVICVGFTDASYCSLKYYLDNKQTINKTPSSLFMIGLIDNTETPSSLQTLCPINMADIKYHYWQRNEQTGVISDSEGSLQCLFPVPVLRTLTTIPDTRNVGVTNVGTLAFPLIACMGGGRLNLTNYWTSKPAAGTPIFGGRNDYHYTIHAEDSFVYTHLSEYAFDDVMSVAACYGLPFAIEFPENRNNFYSDPSINTYIPVANDGGYYDGRFELLTIAGVVSSELSPENAVIYNGGKNAPYNDRTYNPDIPIPADVIDLINPTLTGIDCFNKTYVCNRNDIEELGGYFWSADDDILSKVIKAFELFGEKPINGVINLMLFPFDVRSKTGATSQENIKIGTWDSGIGVYRLPQTARAVYDFGSFKWERLYNNFLDYAPFTTAELYVPFFGVFPLANENFIGKTIDIKCVVDFITGAATCIIYVTDNGMRQPVIYRNANLGVQIPVSGDDVQARITSYIDGATKASKDITQAGTAAVTGDISGVAKNVGTAAAHLFGAAAQPTVFNSAGSSSPECSLYLPKKPYIILHLPDTMIPDNYGHTVGFATEETTTINDVSGYAVFSNVDTSGIAATLPELDEIKRLLETGVYC